MKQIWISFDQNRTTITNSCPENWWENNMKQIIASVFFDILSYTIGYINFCINLFHFANGIPLLATWTFQQLFTSVTRRVKEYTRFVGKYDARFNAHKPPKPMAPTIFMLDRNFNWNVLVSSIPIDWWKEVCHAHS